MMLKEKRVEVRIRDWLAGRGFSVRSKGISVDIEARDGKRRLWAIEVKGDQKNYGALRLTFFTALGQVLTARTRHSEAKVSLALTSMFREFVEKFADVLVSNRVSVIWVSTRRIKHDNLRGLRPDFRKSRQGHPNGLFASGCARYCVTKGSLAWVKVDGKRKGEITTFAQLCRLLGIDVKTDAASRVLYRYSFRTGRNT